jgi:hypothetical protein
VQEKLGTRNMEMNREIENATKCTRNKPLRRHYGRKKRPDVVVL